jgi:hypothetical protein
VSGLLLPGSAPAATTVVWRPGTAPLRLAAKVPQADSTCSCCSSALGTVAKALLALLDLGQLALTLLILQHRSVTAATVATLNDTRTVLNVKMMVPT